MERERPAQYTDLDPVVKGRISGLFEAATILDVKADFHNDELDKSSNTDHHRAARNTANNMAHKLRREAVEVALDPKSSKYYHEDKQRAENE
jgi:hypothetical protein